MPDNLKQFLLEVLSGDGVAERAREILKEYKRKTNEDEQEHLLAQKKPHTFQAQSGPTANASQQTLKSAS